MTYPDNIVIEQCPKIISLKTRPLIINLLKSTLLKTNSKDYSEREIEELIASYNEGLIFRRKIFNAIARVRESNEVVGIASASNSGIILAAFVHPQYQRRGIGTALLSTLEKSLSAKDINYIWLTSSITAESFFEEMGYQKLLKVKAQRRITVSIMRKETSQGFSFQTYLKDITISSYYLFNTLLNYLP